MPAIALLLVEVAMSDTPNTTGPNQLVDASPRVSAPVSAIVAFGALLLGAGGGIPIYRAAAGAGSEVSALAEKLERVETRIRDLELGARTAAEHSAHIDESLIDLKAGIAGINDKLDALRTSRR